MESDSALPIPDISLVELYRFSTHFSRLGYAFLVTSCQANEADSPPSSDSSPMELRRQPLTLRDTWYNNSHYLCAEFELRRNLGAHRRR